MKTMNLNEVNKNLKKMEEAELKVVLFEVSDVIVASGCTGNTCDGDCTNDCGDNTCTSNTCTSFYCLAKGTKIKMADGTLKNIEDIVEGDKVLTFNHEAGCFVGSEILYAYKGDAPKCAVTVIFDNDVKLSIIGEHDLFEKESNKYVTITDKNAEQFIGKHFYSVEEKSYVELINVVHETEAVEYYELYTKNNMNTVANGMLNVADDVDYLLNIYEFDENLKANKKVLADDIEKYGLFEFSAEYGYSKEEYDAWNMRYLNIAVGKGLTTWDKLFSNSAEYLEQTKGEETSECA